MTEKFVYYLIAVISGCCIIECVQDALGGSGLAALVGTGCGVFATGFLIIYDEIKKIDKQK